MMTLFESLALHAFWFMTVLFAIVLLHVYLNRKGK